MFRISNVEANINMLGLGTRFFPENVKKNILEFLVPDRDKTNTSQYKPTAENKNNKENNDKNIKKQKEPPPAVTLEREKKKQDCPSTKSEQGIQAFSPNALKHLSI